nr:hypothetical protein CFP56_58167 [Quercus suber]
MHEQNDGSNMACCILSRRIRSSSCGRRYSHMHEYGSSTSRAVVASCAEGQGGMSCAGERKGSVEDVQSHHQTRAEICNVPKWYVVHIRGPGTPGPGRWVDGRWSMAYMHRR